MKKGITLFLFFSIVSFSLSGQVKLPNLPLENIHTVFHVSPLTIDPLNAPPDSLVYACRQTWDAVAEKWSDTTAMFEHAVALFGDELCYTEVFATKQSGSFTNEHRIEVYNPSDWDGTASSIPDSIIFYSWDINSAAWVRKRKVEYVKTDVLTFDRQTTLADHIIPDTLEKIFIDTFWDHRVRQRFVFVPSLQGYTALDSTVYLYSNGLCQTFGIYDQRDGVNKPLQRSRFQYFGDAENYTIEMDFWSDSINFWQSVYKLSRVYLPDEQRIRWQYDTLTTIAWQSYKRMDWQFNPDWSPVLLRTELFPGLGTFPDTAYQDELFYNTLTGRLNAVFSSKKIFPENWELQSRWLFGTAPVVGLPGVPDPEFIDFKLRTLGNGQFQLVFPPQYVLKGQARLFDVSGRLLHSWLLNNSVFDIVLSDKPAGIYYLQLIDPSGFKTVPLVRY